MTNEKCVCNIRKPAAKRAFGRLRVDRRIILKWILKKQGGRVWTEYIWLRIWSNSGLY
jgi:hypothetical protein